MKSKTIDGVPRDVLMTVLSEPRPDAPYCVLKARAVLRALLDAPVMSRQDLSAADWSLISGLVAKEYQNARRANLRAGTPIASEKAAARMEMVGSLLRTLGRKPAAQPQGEPVATVQQYRVVRHDPRDQKYSDWFEIESDAKREQIESSLRLTAMRGLPAVYELRTLYAEQPAPVALEVGEPYAYEYEFATVLYASGPGKFKKVLTLEAPDQHEIDAGCVINVKPLYSHERRKYDDTLLPFLALMRRELHANSHKGDREGWLTMDPLQATSEIYHHAEKLAEAVAARDYPQITEYTADVANCAMMLLDVCNGLPRNNQ